MIVLLARRVLTDRPRRTAMLLLGLGIAVGVMITLLSIGDAVLEQARDKDLVGGGDLVLLPAGIDVEVMKIGGATGMYSMLDNARFLYRQVLSGPRFLPWLAEVRPAQAALPAPPPALAAASPALVEKVVYLRVVHDGTPSTDAPVQALAHGFIPSLDRAVGGPTAEFAAQGIDWRDQHADHMWTDPPVDSLYNAMDRFHLPPRGQPGLDRWAEWLYFNFTDQRTGTFGYVSFIVGGDLEAGEGRAVPVLQIERAGQPPLEFRDDTPLSVDDISLERVDLRFGPKTTAVFREGAYRLHLEWENEGGPVRADLTVRPVLDLYFPPFLIHESERFISGYTVPGIRTTMSGTIEAGGVRLDLDDVPGYHDHNWGTWRNVHWDWGTSSSPEYGLLYGRVEHPRLQPGRSGAGIFLMLSQARRGEQRGGLLGLFRPERIDYAWEEAGPLPGNPSRVPTAITLFAEHKPTSLGTRQPDRVVVRIEVQQVTATAPREGRENLVFLQLQGQYQVHARIAGREISFDSPGFAEVFVPARTP
ncbi:MAG: hypothetical protein ACE5G2_03390 [Candidatus Krumholzibacteriia bacterium]